MNEETTMELEINLEKIAIVAIEKKEENSGFRHYLEEQNPKEIDRLVQRLNNEIAPKIDCCDCGNCCDHLRPAANYEDLKPFVKEEDMEDFKYLEYFTCKNLKDKKCTVYLDRPDVCKDYPYLDRDGFISRIVGGMINYGLCPIVYNLMEQLKKELNWRFEDRL